MGNVVSSLITILDKYTLWIYLLLALISLIYVRNLVIARRSRTNSPYTIEREVAAHKEGRALIGMGVMLSLAAAITAVKMFVLPGIDITKLNEPTPTLTLPAATKVFATLTPAPTITASSAQDATPRPTRPAATAAPTAEAPTAPPAPTAAPPPAACPNGGVQITSPGSGATVSGAIAITGNANHEQFQFYKVEYSLGEQPGEWRVIGDLHHQAVNGGVLETLNSAALPNGTAWLQLTVVDQSGNFPEPCRVRIVIAN